MQYCCENKIWFTTFWLLSEVWGFISKPTSGIKAFFQRVVSPYCKVCDETCDNNKLVAPLFGVCHTNLRLFMDILILLSSNMVDFYFIRLLFSIICTMKVVVVTKLTGVIHCTFCSYYHSSWNVNVLLLYFAFFVPAHKGHSNDVAQCFKEKRSKLQYQVFNFCFRSGTYSDEEPFCQPIPNKKVE